MEGIGIFVKELERKSDDVKFRMSTMYSSSQSCVPAVCFAFLWIDAYSWPFFVIV